MGAENLGKHRRERSKRRDDTTRAIRFENHLHMFNKSKLIKLVKAKKNGTVKFSQCIKVSINSRAVPNASEDFTASEYSLLNIDFSPFIERKTSPYT